LFYVEFELATNYKHIDAMHLVGNQYCVGNSKKPRDCIRRTNTGVTKYECFGADAVHSPLQDRACALLQKNCAHASPLYDADVTWFNLKLRLPGARREVTHTDVLTWGPPSATGMTPYKLGIAPSQLGTNPYAQGTAPSQMGTAPSQMGTAPSQMGTAPSQMGTAPSQLGSCPRQLESLWRSQESLEVLNIPVPRLTDRSPHNLDEYERWLQLDGEAYDAVFGNKKALHSQCFGVHWSPRGWHAQVNFHYSTEILTTVPNLGGFGVNTIPRTAYFVKNKHFNLKRVRALDAVYDHSEEYRACLACDYAVKVALLLDLHKPFGHTNPSGVYNSDAFKGFISPHAGMTKPNFPGVSEAEYSSVLGPLFRAQVAARAFAFLTKTPWALAHFVSLHRWFTR
jgi:hypothetical protein